MKLATAKTMLYSMIDFDTEDAGNVLYDSGAGSLPDQPTLQRREALRAIVRNMDAKEVQAIFRDTYIEEAFDDFDAYNEAVNAERIAEQRDFDGVYLFASRSGE